MEPDQAGPVPLHANDALYFRDLFLDVALDTERERDRCRGAPDTGTLEADGDDAIGVYVDEFDVPAVRLSQW